MYLPYLSCMSLKIAIIDDEKHACETLVWQLNKISIPHEVVGVYQKPAEAIRALSGNAPDVLLLDIEMPGLNGFQFLAKLNLPDIQVIFTTAYDEFALKAFRVNAVDYLIKPVDAGELEAALRKAQNQRATYNPHVLKEIFNRFHMSKAGNARIGLPSVHGIDFVNCNEILFCQSDSNYCRIYLATGRKIFISKTLKEIESMLPDALFLRVHKSYIVNLSRVLSFVNEGDGVLVLEDGARIKVSRIRKKEILDRLYGTGQI